MKKFFKIAVCLVIIICIVFLGCVAYFFHIIGKDDRMAKDDVFTYVTENQDVLINSIRYIDELKQQYGDEIICIKHGADIGAKEISNNKIYLVLFDKKYIQLYNADINEILSDKRIKNISISDKYVEFSCSGYGMGPATGYAGFYYSYSEEGADLDLSPPKNELAKDGNGWSYKELNGDNTYYEENIVDKFYYYTAEF